MYGGIGRAQHHIGLHPGGRPHELLHGERIVAQQSDEGRVVRVGVLSRVGGRRTGQQHQRNQACQDCGPAGKGQCVHGVFLDRVGVERAEATKPLRGGRFALGGFSDDEEGLVYHGEIRRTTGMERSNTNDLLLVLTSGSVVLLWRRQRGHTF